MLLPVSLENNRYNIHPFRSEDFDRYEQLVSDVYRILTDTETLKFIPEKRLTSMEDADLWLKTNILNFHCGRNYIHFITDKTTGKLLGIFDIITPQLAESHYRLKNYPHFIEFYLSGSAQGKKIMSIILPQLIAEIKLRKINLLGAVVNRTNLAA